MQGHYDHKEGTPDSYREATTLSAKNTWRALWFLVDFVICANKVLANAFFKIQGYTYNELQLAFCMECEKLEFVSDTALNHSPGFELKVFIDRIYSEIFRRC